MSANALDLGSRLLHAPEDDRARSRRARARPRRDRLPSRARRPRAAAARRGRTPVPSVGWPAKRISSRRVEDADPSVASRLGREHEGRLRESDLERERLHRLRVEPACVGEDGELVPRQRRVREDVDDDVAVGRHRPTLTGRPGCISSPRRAERNRRSQPHEVLRQRRGASRDQLRRRPGRGIRAARAERRREDDDGRDPRGLPQARRRRGLGARARSRRAPHESCGSASASFCSSRS